jgi:gas vesicle protein
MSRGDSTGAVITFILGIGVGAAAVLLLGSKRVEQLRDDLSVVLNDGLDQVRDKGKDLMRQTRKTVDIVQQKVQEAFDAGSDAYSQAKKS